MRTARKLTIIFAGFFYVLIILTHSLNASVIQIEGEMGSTVTAYIKRWFSSYEGTKNLSYRIYFPKTFTEGINTQIISNFRKSFTPYPNDLREFTDEFGNSGVELIWNKEIKIVQLDLQFTVKTYTNFSPLSSIASFPATIDDDKRIFLTSTDLAPKNDFYINYIGRSISKGLNREIDVVNSIFLWIDRNIRLSNNPENKAQYDALSVLRKREGDEKGICNLTVALMKGLGIPARIVYGVSFQKEIRIVAENRNIIYDLPNSERYWVEIFFPDIGWVSYDPHGMYFGTISHVIKLSVGPDTDFVSEAWRVEQGEAEIQKEFIYDIKSDYSNITFKKYSSLDINKLVLSPYLPDVLEYQDEPNLEIEGLIKETIPEELEAGITGITGMIHHNSDISNSLDIDATRTRVYAQKFDIEYPIVLSEVNLPLLKFSDEGTIWVEIYTDTNGVPGKLLFRTYSINSTKLRFMMIENPWLSFPVGKKTKASLESGGYWFALRSSGSCIFNWYASEGNVFGHEIDTVYRDVNVKKLNWNNILNYDMNFQLIGTREEEKID